MSKSLPKLVTSADTFQILFQRTNDIITELGTSVLTASNSGDNTVGNASLTGQFTANTAVIQDTLRTNIIDSKVGNSSPIEIRSITNFTSSNQHPLELTNTVGPRIKFDNNNVAWDAGLRGSSSLAEFVISPDFITPMFRFTQYGKIIANTFVATSGITLNNSINPGTLLIGTNFDGSNTTTWSVDASPFAINNKVVVRNAVGNFAANTITALSNIVADGIILNGTTISSSGVQLNYSNTLTSNVQTQLNNKQTKDTTLTALSGYNSNGFFVQTALDTFTSRSITVGTGLSITNGDGIADNPAINLSIATQAQAQAGTLNTVAMTPLRTANAIASQSALKFGTSISPTGVTFVDFTGIPSTAKRITVIFNNLNTSAISDFIVQIGSGSIDSTGYNSVSQLLTNGTTTVPHAISNNTGFILYLTGYYVNNNKYSGTMVLNKFDAASNDWISTHNVGCIVNDAGFLLTFGSGVKSLTGLLNTLRVTTTNGTYTFDAGSVNIVWE